MERLIEKEVLDNCQKHWHDVSYEATDDCRMQLKVVCSQLRGQMCRLFRVSDDAMIDAVMSDLKLSLFVLKSSALRPTSCGIAGRSATAGNSCRVSDIRGIGAEGVKFGSAGLGCSYVA